MELASMLAGEPFSDHPRSASRSIGAFLRSYNDMIDEDRRQDLYAYASRVVDTVAPDRVEALRAARLIAWGDEVWKSRSRRSPFARFRRRAAFDRRHNNPESAARYAIGSIARISEELHAAALTLVDELIAIGATDGSPISPHQLVSADRPHVPSLISQ
jgi:hypothetical protein